MRRPHPNGATAGGPAPAQRDPAPAARPDQRRPWTRAEDAELARLYGSGVPRREIAVALGRSTDAVDARRRALRIPVRPAAAPWSSDEDALLRAASRVGLPAAEVARRLGRPPAAVRWRRRTLGLQGRGTPLWSTAEDQALARTWTGGGDLAGLAAALGRSAAALRLRAGVLGLTRPASRRRWQPEDDRRLRAGYADGLTCAAIAAGLGRSEGAVVARARKLGLGAYARRWTAAEEAHLARLVERGVPLERAACLLIRTPEALRVRARRLGIQPPAAVDHPRARRRWTEAEDELLARHPGLDPARLALQLGRSDGAVRQRLATLGLRQDRARSPHHPVGTGRRLTPAQQRLLAREFQPDNARVLRSLASRLGLPPATVKHLTSLQALAAAPAAAEPPGQGRRQDGG
jgi:DNA-binding CsgD family transcriptional regulator